MSRVMNSASARMVVSVSRLSVSDRANVRCVALLAASRLADRWHVSDLDHGADCRLVPPEPGSGSVGSLQVDHGDETLVFELDWPLLDTRLVDAFNRASVRRAQLPPPASERRSASWLANLIGGLTRHRAATGPADAHALPATFEPAHRQDLRPSLSNYLKRFGRREGKRQLNVLLVGSPGSGKTTAINTVASGPVRSTEVTATDTVAALKTRTTIALDYGQCETELYRLRLFGTPGQLRFAHMIRQTLVSCDAALVLADATSADPLDDVCRYVSLLEGFGSDDRPMVVAYTHLDEARMPRDFSSRLAKAIGRRAAVLPLDPRDRGSVLRTLNLLTSTLAPRDAGASAGPLRASAPYG